MSLRFRQIHLDFHTSEKIVEVGEAFDPEEFADTFQRAAVDSVTLFARCHHGMIYYDTKFTHARHPGLKRDLLKEQIDALHSRGIKAPIYITVGWDEHMARLHPEYIEVDADGKWIGAPPLGAGWRKLCLNSPYIDYVFEQTEEVLQRFQVDGLFFDIIKQVGCCCPRCLKGMEEEGLDPEDPAQRQRWNQLVVDRYCRHQTELVRRYNSQCTIFYNAGHVGPWIRTSIDEYSHLELESLPTGGWGYDHFPLTVRYARNLGKEYLGMTGKFQKSWADFGGFKPQPALEADVFSALAFGARCSIGDQLHPTGRLDPATYDLIGPVYRSVQEKEPWCVGVQAVTEIAVVTPEAVGQNEGRVDESVRGAMRLLQEAHFQFDIVDFDMPLDRYSLVILPDKIVLTEEQAQIIRAYVAQGGSLVASYVSGADVSRSHILLRELGVEMIGELPYSPDYLEPVGPIAKGVRPTQHVMYDRGAQVRVVDADASVLAKIWKPYFNREYKHFTSHRHAPAERPTDDPGIVQTGRCIYFAHPIFSTYGKHGPEACRQMAVNAVRLLVERQVVRSDAPTSASITVMRQPEKERTVVHLLHYVPEARYSQLDLVVERYLLHDVGIDLALEKRPERVYLAPEEKELPFQWNGQENRVEVRVPKVDGHAMVVFE